MDHRNPNSPSHLFLASQQWLDIQDHLSRRRSQIRESIFRQTKLLPSDQSLQDILKLHGELKVIETLLDSKAVQTILVDAAKERQAKPFTPAE